MVRSGRGITAQTGVPISAVHRIGGNAYTKDPEMFLKDYKRVVD